MILFNAQEVALKSAHFTKLKVFQETVLICGGYNLNTKKCVICKDALVATTYDKCILILFPLTNKVHFYDPPHPPDLHSLQSIFFCFSFLGKGCLEVQVHSHNQHKRHQHTSIIPSARTPNASKNILVNFTSLGSK